MAISDWLSNNKIYSFEGEAGIANLEKLVRHIGYVGDGCTRGSPIDAFLADNPDAIECLVDFIGESYEDVFEGETSGRAVKDHRSIETGNSDANDLLNAYFVENKLNYIKDLKQINHGGDWTRYMIVQHSDGREYRFTLMYVRNLHDVDCEADSIDKYYLFSDTINNDGVYWNFVCTVPSPCRSD